MTPLTTLRALMPCPSCGAVGPRVVAVQAPASTTELLPLGPRHGFPGGTFFGRVSDCEGCWARRAELVAAARRLLRRSGELSSLGPGREDAWLGVPLSRCEEEFENAFASALMKVAQGAPLPPPARKASVELAASSEDERASEPQLVPA